MENYELPYNSLDFHKSIRGSMNASTFNFYYFPFLFSSRLKWKLCDGRMEIELRLRRSFVNNVTEWLWLKERKFWKKIGWEVLNYSKKIELQGIDSDRKFFFVVRYFITLIFSEIFLIFLSFRNFTEIKILWKLFHTFEFFFLNFLIFFKFFLIF